MIDELSSALERAPAPPRFGVSFFSRREEFNLPQAVSFNRLELPSDHEEPSPLSLCFLVDRCVSVTGYDAFSPSAVRGGRQAPFSFSEDDWSSFTESCARLGLHDLLCALLRSGGFPFHKSPVRGIQFCSANLLLPLRRAPPPKLAPLKTPSLSFTSVDSLD